MIKDILNVLGGIVIGFGLRGLLPEPKKAKQIDLSNVNLKIDEK